MEAAKVKIQTTPGFANTLREAWPKIYAEEGKLILFSLKLELNVAFTRPQRFLQISGAPLDEADPLHYDEVRML